MNEAEWSILEPLMVEYEAGDPVKYELRDIFDAILYQTRSGCAWRYLPRDLPKWQAVLRYQTLWTRSGLLDAVHTTLRRRAREAEGRKPEPTVAILDAQTVQSAGVTQEVGFDGHKKKKGRKRTLVTDTCGFVLAVGLCAANIHDAVAATNIVNVQLATDIPTIRTISADLGYQGSFERSINNNPELPFEIDIVRRPDGGNGGLWTQDHSIVSPATADRPFPILRRRWVIERTNGWNMLWRRLRIDYEREPETSRARVLLASIGRMFGRLTP